MAGLETQVNKPDFADVVFVIGTERVYAHRVLLSTCDYFATMFKSGFAETECKSNIRQVELPEETQVDAFLCVLDFLYTGCVSRVNAENVLSVLHMAQQYLLTKLIDECLVQLPWFLSAENLLEFWFALDRLDIHENIIWTNAIQ